MQPKIYHDLPHWRFYRSLEDDLEACFKFIAPEQEHFEVYSDEFAKIILLAASEFENVLGEFKFWSTLSPSDKRRKKEDIKTYYKYVHERFPLITSMRMVLPRFSIGCSPLDGWSLDSGPEWWSNGYNKIKHDRLGNPNAPTLRRAFNAVAGLQVVLLHFYRLRHKNAIMPWRSSPSLIIPWDITDVSHGESFGWGWKLPGEESDWQ